jgi:tagatose 1,6-diphosphate aldolase
MKAEVPINMKFVEGVKSNIGKGSAYTRKEALDLFRKSAAVSKKPFIYLSAGVSNDEFAETLELAAESGVKFNGVLCGRATWADAVPVFAKQGEKAFVDWMKTKGVENIQNVNARLKAATPWYEAYGAKSDAALAS